MREISKFRISERLRPCSIKGWPCRNCAPGDERCAVKYRKSPCDGSGVLPARERRH